MACVKMKSICAKIALSPFGGKRTTPENARKSHFWKNAASRRSEHRPPVSFGPLEGIVRTGERCPPLHSDRIVQLPPLPDRWQNPDRLLLAAGLYAEWRERDIPEE